MHNRYPHTASMAVDYSRYTFYQSAAGDGNPWLKLDMKASPICCSMNSQFKETRTCIYIQKREYSISKIRAVLRPGGLGEGRMFFDTVAR